MLKQKYLTLENGLYALIFLLGVTLRLLNLGVVPLSDAEADLAMRALAIARGAPVTVGVQPGYTLLTGFLFYLFGSSEFLARFLPAFSGSLLLLAPVMFRRFTGREAGLLMSVWLALDPGLVAVSRQVDGPMLALSFLLLSIGLLTSGNRLAAGISFGLALLSGPMLFQGLLVVLVGWGFALFFRVLPVSGATQPDQDINPFAPHKWRPALIAALITLLLVGSYLGRIPQGLSAVLGQLPAYLSGWLNPSGLPATRLLLALVIYQPLAVIFALAGWVREPVKSSQSVWILRIWLLVGLALSLIYPGRQTHDLVFILPAVIGLAALELGRYLQVLSQDKAIVFGQMVVITMLMALFWLNLAGMGQSATGEPFDAARLAIVAGIIALGVVTTLLVGLGWSWRAAQGGVILGVCTALLFYSIANLWSSSQLRQGAYLDLWNNMPVTGDADLLIDTINQISAWETGRTDYIDIQVAVVSPALEWLLRNYPEVTFTSELMSMTTGSSPSIVITRQFQSEPTLSASYRGQDFTWWVSPDWSGINLPAFASWLVFRRIPLVYEQIILWARADLFPGSADLVPILDPPPGEEIPEEDLLP